MARDSGCWRLRRAVLVTETSLPNVCATVSSEGHAVRTCPPAVDKSREFKARTANELDLLPGGATIAAMLADYVVMRGQICACQHRR